MYIVVVLLIKSYQKRNAMKKSYILLFATLFIISNARAMENVNLESSDSESPTQQKKRNQASVNKKTALKQSNNGEQLEEVSISNKTNCKRNCFMCLTCPYFICSSYFRTICCPDSLPSKK